jgi:hypothetical protein
MAYAEVEDSKHLTVGQGRPACLEFSGLKRCRIDRAPANNGSACNMVARSLWNYDDLSVESHSPTAVATCDDDSSHRGLCSQPEKQPRMFVGIKNKRWTIDIPPAVYEICCSSLW